MSPRTTGIVCLVAAALFAFIYFYEIRGEDARKEAESAEKQLFPGVDAEAIDAIALTTTDRRETRIERSDGGWQLREPLVFPADGFAVDGMASALADLESQAVYTEPQPLEVYGLGEAAEKLSFEVGGTEHAVRIGDKTPMGSNTYVAVEGDDQVYSVASFGVNTLRKSLDDLRDKRVSHFDVDAIDRIEASWSGGGVVLAKGDAGWRLVQPLEGDADERTIDSLLTSLAFLRASGFEDAPLSDAEAGLAEPAFSAELHGEPAEEGGKPVDVRIAIGQPLDHETRLVRSAAPSLYRIPVERIQDFPREVVAYRFKQLADFPQTDAQRVEIVFQRMASSEEGDAPLEVTATRGERGWTSEPERFKPGRVAGLVSELARLRAADILADEMGEGELAGLGLSPPNTQISVYGKDDALLARVRLGISRGEGGGVVAQAEGLPAVFELAPEASESIPVSLEAFRSSFRSEEQEQPGPS